MFMSVWFTCTSNLAINGNTFICNNKTTYVLDNVEARSLKKVGTGPKICLQKLIDGPILCRVKGRNASNRKLVECKLGNVNLTEPAQQCSVEN